MRDASYIVALFGVVILLAAIGFGWKLVRAPRIRSSSAAGRDDRRTNAAGIALAIALGLSVAATTLAILGWFARV
jgi:multisubunit Na+/H+ antiporter MnhB subunit